MKDTQDKKSLTVSILPVSRLLNHCKTGGKEHKNYDKIFRMNSQVINLNVPEDFKYRII